MPWQFGATYHGVVCTYLLSLQWSTSVLYLIYKYGTCMVVWSTKELEFFFTPVHIFEFFNYFIYFIQLLYKSLSWTFFERAEISSLYFLQHGIFCDMNMPALRKSCICKKKPYNTVNGKSVHTKIFFMKYPDPIFKYFLIDYLIVTY
jgi:hypothetical protein